MTCHAEGRSSSRRSGTQGIREKQSEGEDNMPLRGSLFKKIFATRKERENIEKKQLKDHFSKQSQELVKIRKKRIEAQGKRKLSNLLADEKRMLSAAKGPTKISRFESFLGKQAKRGLTAAEFKAKRQIIKKLKKRRTTRKRRRRRRSTSLL